MTNDTENIFENRGLIVDPITALLKTGARQLLEKAIEVELKDFMLIYEGLRTHDGKPGVVRNGYLPERKIQTGIGPISVKVPKVRSRTGEAITFNSSIVPPYVRKARTLEAAIPWLYLKGVSTGEMADALAALLGSDAEGLSASTISRLKNEWAAEYEAWRKAPLDKDEWVYIWADGIYSGVRGENEKLCALVVVGVNSQGEKHYLAIEDGARESTLSWRDVLLGLKSRGMNMPKLAVADGAMGFWAALSELFPETAQQRCWVHKMENILNHFPKSLQARAKRGLQDIWRSDTQGNAEEAFDLFVNTYEVKYPKATQSLQADREELMAFYDFPAKHWPSIRTSNPIESTFSTIRHRTKRCKGCLSKQGMLHMMFKLSQCSQKRWMRLRGFDELPKLIKGIKFKDGIQVQEAA
jgi:putative transposase